MPIKEFFSVRVIEPEYCSKYYAESRPGPVLPGKMEIYSCILKKHEDEIKDDNVTNEQWRKFGVTQRFLLPIDNVEPCVEGKGKNAVKTLCPLNDAGKRELASIEKRFGKVIKMKGGTDKEFVVSKIPIGFMK